jgi:hypothetical protein
MYPLLLSDINKTSFISAAFKKIGRTSNSMKNPSREESSCSTQTDGWTVGQTNGQRDRQTDMIKLIVAFRNFENSPEILTLHEEVPQNIIP